jgi:hypothetical protein
MALESENTNLTYTGYDISENAIKIMGVPTRILQGAKNAMSNASQEPS